LTCVAKIDWEKAARPKISFIMITARANFPYLGRPDLHVFEPTLESFKQQTMLDFEWVIVDALYEQRKNYFKNMKLPFQVKHVPAKPNLWIEKGFPGISTQYNKGIIYADGELLFFTGDSHMVLPNFMEQLWRRYQEGYFPFAWYFFDNSFTEALDNEPVVGWRQAYPEQVSPAPCQPYNILGYSGKKVSIEHRYVEAFKNNNLPLRHAPWEWWFGCSSASLEAMLKINGFNQNFDGDRMLLDCDVGSRLNLAGYGTRFALFRDIFLIRAATDINKWNPELNKDKITIKCNYPLIWHSRYFNKYKANSEILTDKDIQWIKEIFCQRHCPIRELCQREHPWQFPFEHKAGYPGHNSSKQWFNFWKKHQSIINLAEEREKRLSDY
jgi:glycosyltransferase involved in cell wall biosynthesis